MESIPQNTLSNSDKDITYIAKVPKGYTLETILKKQKKKPSFMMVGNGLNNAIKKGAYSMDYTEMLLGLSKPAGFLFGKIMKNRIPEDTSANTYGIYKYSNYSTVTTKDLTAMEKKYIVKGYKELREKDMVIRVKRGVYLINPRLVVSGDNWEAEEHAYNKIAAEHKEKESK